MSDNLVTLAEVCKELKIEPRAARIRLRASEVEHDGRYAWPKGQLAKIRTIIQGDAPAPKAAAAKKATPTKKATPAKKAPAKKPTPAPERAEA